MLEIIALDLEGTLISNAISQIARPGLYAFLDGCKSITERVVIFTTVKEEPFRKIAQLLVSQDSVPAWFPSIEYVKWTGQTKDLNWIQRASVAACVLVLGQSDSVGYHTSNFRFLALILPDISTLTEY
jgi:hypothetical protein